MQSQIASAGYVNRAVPGSHPTETILDDLEYAEKNLCDVWSKWRVLRCHFVGEVEDAGGTPLPESMTIASRVSRIRISTAQLIDDMAALQSRVGEFGK